MLEWRSITHTTVGYLWLKSYTACHAWGLWRVLYLPAKQCSCSPSTCDNQPSKTTQLRSFYRTFWHPTAQIWIRFTAQYGRNAAAGLASWWRRWTEAVVDRCLASFQAKHHRWRSWWVAQMSLSAQEFVWKEELLALNSIPIWHILCVNFNIKQVLLCELRQNFAYFVLLHFVRQCSDTSKL